MGAQTCTGCVEDQRFRNRTFKSILQMEQHFKKYAEDNLLGLYGHRLQHAIEKLYTLEQFHICDLLVSLSCQKKMTERDQILMDVERIDLQQLDHMSSVEDLTIDNLRSTENARDIYLEEQGEGSRLKILHHRNLKHRDQDNDPLENMFHTHKFAVFAAVECFNNFNVLTTSGLPSNRSPLQLFLEKVQIVNSTYHCSLNVVFIVNPRFDREFEEEIERYLKVRDLQSSRDTETSLFDLKYHKILYKPIFPCVNDQGKILVENNQLKFEYSSGDLLGFIMKEPYLQKFLQKYEFFQFANIARLIEEVGEREGLIYLETHPHINIIAHATEETPQLEVEKCIKLRKSFIQTQDVQKGMMERLIKLNDSYYMRSSLFVQQESNQLFHKLISTRIQSKELGPGERHFVRELGQVLYAPFTIIITRENIDAKGFQATPAVEYSNYCKKRIGIRDTSDEEIVEMCPQILFGPREQFKTIVERLRALPKIGFPLVVNKEKIQSIGGRN